jgi:hypothetical protein
MVWGGEPRYTCSTPSKEIDLIGDGSIRLRQHQSTRKRIGHTLEIMLCPYLYDIFTVVRFLLLDFRLAAEGIVGEQNTTGRPYCC